MKSSSRLLRVSTDFYKSAARRNAEQARVRHSARPEEKPTTPQALTLTNTTNRVRVTSKRATFEDGEVLAARSSNRSTDRPALRAKKSGLKSKSPSTIKSSSKPKAEMALGSLELHASGQLEPKNLNFYKVTDAPSTPQLDYASYFFHKHKPTLLASFPEFRLFPDTAAPEVCFLGRSNVGKSSLINAIFRGHKTEISAHVSKKAGRTTTMNAFAVGPSIVGLKTHGVNKAGQVVRWEAAPRQWVGKGGLVLIDLQGYGLNSREKWGQEIMKLLTKRKQLRRAFVLIDSKDGLQDNDIDLLTLLRNSGVPHQIIFTKADKILFNTGKAPASPDELRKHVKTIKDAQHDMWGLLTDRSKWQSTGQSALCDILVTIAAKDIAASWRLGINPLRFAILQAAGLDCDKQGRRISAAALDAAVAVETVKQNRSMAKVAR